MVRKVAFDKSGDPYLTDEETTVAENLRTMGVETNETTFDVSSIPLQAHHNLIQEGSYVKCTDQNHSHSSHNGAYIGPDKNLIKRPDGSYDLETIK